VRVGVDTLVTRRGSLLLSATMERFGMNHRPSWALLLCAFGPGTFISATAAELCVNGNPNLCCEEKGWGYDITSVNGTQHIRISSGRDSYERIRAARVKEEQRYKNECAHGNGYFCNRTFGPLACFDPPKKRTHQGDNPPAPITWPGPHVSPSPTVSPSPSTTPSPKAGVQTPGH
jgi:hypothetical protein